MNETNYGGIIMARQAMNEGDQIDASRDRDAGYNRATMRDAGEPTRGQDDRQQSKTEDAFQAISDRMETLGIAVMNLEDRLLLVLNNYPRESDNVPKEAKDEGPTGESELLNRLYRIREDVARQTTRVNAIMQRLDI
jgi:hypothetical protein